MDKPVTVAVLGAGNRGRDAYGQFIKEHPGEIKAVAVAEPDESRRELFAGEHDIPGEYRFSSWEELLSEERLADGIIIATLDNMHVEPAIMAMERGYKILLEKPIAPNWKDTVRIARKAKETGSKILVAHVLRYTNFYRELKRLLEERVIGEIRFVDHIENIGFFHFAHSYVRGNWRNTDIAAPIILAKSCHDLDLIYWLLGKKCLELSSRASLEFFTPENQPAGAGDRCLNCPVEQDCPYSACKIYLSENTGWPVSVITTDLSYEGRYRALEEGPYGRCVFKCDNNIPEVQSVCMSFEGNIEVNFALTAFSYEINRTSKFFGTRGEIRADFEEGLIEVYRFGQSGEKRKVTAAAGGHGGGDSGLMEQFIELLRGETRSESDGAGPGRFTTIENSLESHLMAFAAEKARREGKISRLEDWRKVI
ncbi:MAG: hypothetical protein PWR10_2214 [Halanaerobiales bacterium]|nr:hypothetical protein [Halanaerobiales bacterium]